MIKSTSRWRLPALLALGAMTAGTVVMTAGSAGATPEFAIERIFGNTRAGTAAQIAAKTFPTGSDNAILVREDDFADALAGNYLAGLQNAPILLVQTNAIPADTATALQSLEVKHVTVLGGTTAVSDGVVAGLTQGGLDVDRIAGTDRFDTAGRIALAGSLLGNNSVGVDGNGDRVAVVSSGRNFPDALAAGPLVFSQHFPQLLTEPTGLSPQTLTALQSLEIDRVYLTGGPAAITDAVQTALTTAGITVTRVAGNTRYDTSLRIAIEAGVNYGYEADHVNLATGTNFPDALAGGPHGGSEKHPILLVPNASAGEDFNFVCGALENLEDSLVSAHLFGGTAAVSDAAVNAFEDCGDGGTATPAGTGQVVAVDAANNKYTFVQTSDNAVRTITYNDNDTFKVDGQTSTLAGFEGAITPGDTIKFTDDATSADVDIHELTNVTVTSGLVGNVNTATDSFAIINPVTGTVVGGPFTYVPGTDVFAGTFTTAATFEDNVNEGDTVTVTTANNVKTITLVNASVSGAVTDFDVVGDNVSFELSNAIGDEFDTAVDDVFKASLAPAVGTEAYTVSGINGAATFAQFKAAISLGDTIAVTRAGNVETFALTNAAPPAQTGQAIDDLNTTDDTFTFVTAAGEVVPVDYTTGVAFTVNGATVATAADLEAAYTPGDTITFQAADAATSTAARVTLVNAPLQGQIANIVLASDEYDVLAADKATVLATIVYTDGTNRYFINGSADANEVNLATFEAKLQDVIDNGTTPAELDDLIQFIPGGVANRHQLTTNDT